MTIPILNLLFRGLAISGRFLVLIGIGRYLTETDLGIYGLFYTTIILGIYFIGLDFYMYNTREIIAREHKHRLPLLRDQLIFHLIAYLLIVPLLFPLFYYNVIPLMYVLWFYLILVFEHLSQELFRIFTALSKSVFANFITFLRSGAWVFILALFWLLHIKPLINLSAILIAWFLGALISVLISLMYISRLNLGTIRNIPVNWYWIKQGIKISMPFFISSLCFRIIEHANRYFIDLFHSKDMVGIFTLLAGTANLVNVVVFTIVVMIDYPILYETHIHNQYAIHQKKKKIFIQKVIYISIGTGIAAAILIHPLLQLIGKYDLYYQYIPTYYMLIIANILYNLSLIPHYLLYILKKDWQIMVTTVLGMSISLIFNYILILWFTTLGAAIAMAISFMIIFLSKWILYHRLVQTE